MTGITSISGVLNFAANSHVAGRGLGAGDLAALRAAPVPEAASLAMLGIAAPLLLRRKIRSHKKIAK